MLRVELSADEILMAVVVAAQRKITSDRRRAAGSASRRPEHYEEQRTWDQEIESSMAEIAVARWRNRYWMGANFNGANSGTDAGNAQVRWTPHSNGHLIIYEEDAVDATFVLVTGRSPVMTIVGWGYASDFRTDNYWRTDVKCPSWWVPQSNLRQVAA